MLWPNVMALLPEPVGLWLLIAGLATWRVTSILHHEKIAVPLRAVFGIREFVFHDTAPVRTYPDNFIGYLFECFMCLSIWVSVLALVALIVFPFILLPFAVSALAIFAQAFFFER